MKLIFNTILILSISMSSIKAHYSKYFPLKIGNYFVYKYTYSSTSGGSGTERRTVKVTKDSILNGKKYFYAQGVFNAWLRLDTIDGNLFAYDSVGCSYYSHEKIIDSLFAKLNGFSNSCWFNTVSTCTDTNVVLLFDISSKHKKLYYGIGGGPGFYTTTRYYSEKFGLYNIYTNGGSSMNSFTSDLKLKGCVIDGILYGDTAFNPSAIVKATDIIPKNFFLSQNYPNPFNPTTNIKFQIPNSRFVNLKIYDLTGKEVETLVSENLGIGEYSVSWNAANFSSGMYFYKLQTNNFTETKKMLLIK